MPKQDHIVHIDAQPDIEKLLDLVKAVLNIPEHAIDPSESAHVEAAGNLVKKIRPDAILLNINAPGLDSEEIFARAGSSSSLNGIVQLLTRARRQDQNAQAKPREGCEAYITQKVEKLESR